MITDMHGTNVRGKQIGRMQLQKKHGMRPMRRSGTYFVGLRSGVPALLAGLFALEVHPITGVLVTLAAMALLLFTATELCQAPGIQGQDLRKQ